jgi:hypothetical protein
MLNLMHLIKEKHISSTQCDFIQSFFGENKLKISENKKIIIFGAGSAEKELEECLSFHGVKIDFFCDNSQEKIGTFLNGTEVISFQDLSTYFKNNLILIGNQNSKTEIIDQLIQSGFHNISYIADSNQFYYYINFPRWKINLNDLEVNITKIKLAYNLLSDELSKEIFLNRLTILSSYADWKSYKKYCELASYPHELPTSMMQFAANFENQMYFNNDLIYLNEGTVVVDCGAFDGDSYFELRKALC